MWEYVQSERKEGECGKRGELWVVVGWVEEANEEKKKMGRWREKEIIGRKVGASLFSAEGTESTTPGSFAHRATVPPCLLIGTVTRLSHGLVES